MKKFFKFKQLLCENFTWRHRGSIDKLKLHAT